VAITYIGLVPVGFGLLAPAGVYFVGVSFTARDIVQDQLGRRMTILAIVIGAALSALLSPSLALASGTAFLVSESLDMLVYTPLRHRHWLGAVALSNTVGLIADSIIFLQLAFNSQEFFLGQVVGKAWMTAVFVIAVWAFRRYRGRRISYAV
jgi:uncharacterized PurR-regulated membrane protein YhhQ (DUF165 family)